jgi:hypothetical protein
VRAGINNVLDTPPPGLTQETTPLPFGNGNTFPGTFDYLGRELFLNATLKL